MWQLLEFTSRRQLWRLEFISPRILNRHQMNLKRVTWPAAQPVIEGDANEAQLSSPFILIMSAASWPLGWSICTVFKCNTQQRTCGDTALSLVGSVSLKSAQRVEVLTFPNNSNSKALWPHSDRPLQKKKKNSPLIHLNEATPWCNKGASTDDSSSPKTTTTTKKAGHPIGKVLVGYVSLSNKV